MLAVTYLGHSGCLVEAQDCRVMLDGILTERFGRGPEGAQFPEMWPPRQFNFQNFPALSGVLASHEHEDHFNLKTFNMLDRRIPVYISSRSSSAAEVILLDMGFRVHRIEPGRKIMFGALELNCISPDHTRFPTIDEWDVLGFHFRDVLDGGCFFTNVDVLAGPGMLTQARDLSHGASRILMFRDEQLSWLLTNEVRSFASSDPKPIRILDAAESARHMLSGGRLIWTPGQRVRLSASELASVEERTPFLCTTEQQSWPERPDWRTSVGSNYPPACGMRELSDSDLRELATGFQGLAEFLYGGKIFGALYSLPSAFLEGSKGTALVLLRLDEEDNFLAFEYKPNSCAFENLASVRPFKEYICGIECWASDLLAVFRGEIEPRILTLGFSRQWNSHPDIPDLFLHGLFPFFHPLRRVRECLNGYRNRLRALQSVDIPEPIHFCEISQRASSVL